MLFRKSTRKRFLCLVAAFLFIMGFNTHSYIKKFQDAEIRKLQTLEEKAFDVFFLRFRTKTDYLKFRQHQVPELARLEAVPLNMAFIYQNNLFIEYHADRPPATAPKNVAGLALLYGLFDLKPAAANFKLPADPADYTVKVRNRYIDHNGGDLDLDIVLARHTALKGDLADAADLIRGNLSGKRLAVFNDLSWKIANSIARDTPVAGRAVNPFFSRVALIVPLNLFHIFANMAKDVTMDIIDYAETVRAAASATLEVEATYLQVPDSYKGTLLYGDIDLYPRYVPVYAPRLLSSRWHWMLYEDIGLNQAFLEKLDRLHFKGNYLFSYEKTLSLKERVKKINADILDNHVDFYMTDLSMDVVFPFMISLFAFIHLKTELAFLLMFKNRIRKLLLVFWLLPLGLILLVKSCLAGFYLVHHVNGALTTAAAGVMLLPMTVAFILSAIIFFPINRWCFSQFTGEQLNLSVLHKGR